MVLAVVENNWWSDLFRTRICEKITTTDFVSHHVRDSRPSHGTCVFWRRPTPNSIGAVWKAGRADRTDHNYENLVEFNSENGNDFFPITQHRHTLLQRNIWWMREVSFCAATALRTVPTLFSLEFD